MTDHLTENARLRAALRTCINMLDDLVAESGRGIEYGEEDAFRMGEWFDDHDLMNVEAARAALATPAPDAVQEAAIDIAAIENGGNRWHGEDHRVVAVRWEPYKPDGQRQMKAKGRWQEQVGSGDYWRWQNCDRPAALRAIAGDRT